MPGPTRLPIPMEESDAWSSRADEDGGQNPTGSEKLACYRCRQRKVKCDRESPCSHCVKSGTQCSYATTLKPRERRQRVMVSHTYDSKLDAISRKIDDLSQRMSHLTHEPDRSRTSKSFDFAAPANTEHCQSFGLTPSPSSLGSTPNQGALPYNPGEVTSEVNYDTSKDEYEGESSLFAHAVFASRFLQNAINNATNAEVAHEMEVALDGLRTAVNSGKQQSDTIDKLYPHARAIPPGSSTRNLPLPPIDKVFACLRMARECQQVATLWLGDYIKPTQFNDYFIKVASPGPATEAELIIVHCGLYWLFCECSKAVTDDEAKQDYDAQALTCKANLETVLANLRFHQPTNIDVAYAMGLASLYCLQKNKPSAAWAFINSAAHTIQALGLQHNASSGEGTEEKTRKGILFWTIYMSEKTLSLRLGRSSTFRDHDITLARPSIERHASNFLGDIFLYWIDLASIQGRVYDEIYSPGALMQPPDIRTSRARALAVELKSAMKNVQNFHDRYEARKGHLLGQDYHEIARCSDRVTGLCVLTLIYRSIPPEKPSTSAFCQECIDTARETLQEHDRCVAAITKGRGKIVFLEAYINWTITQSPFIPFIVMFCHIIETSDGSDLQHMRGLVEMLESTSDTSAETSAYGTCDKQRRLFKALYDVAVKYIEVKARANGAQAGMSWSKARKQYVDAFAGTVSARPAGTLNQQISQDSDGNMPSYGENGAVGLMDGLVAPAALQNPAFGDVDMEMDLSGAELWDWFNKNQSIMRMLEDT